MAGEDVAYGVDIGVGVEPRDAGYDVGVSGGATSDSGAAVGVDDYLPLDRGVGRDGGEDGRPC